GGGAARELRVVVAADGGDRQPVDGARAKGVLANDHRRQRQLLRQADPPCLRLAGRSLAGAHLNRARDARAFDLGERAHELRSGGVVHRPDAGERRDPGLGATPTGRTPWTAASGFGGLKRRPSPSAPSWRAPPNGAYGLPNAARNESRARPAPVLAPPLMQAPPPVYQGARCAQRSSQSR